MSKEELKAALNALKVNEPYKLNQSLTFKKPELPSFVPKSNEQAENDQKIQDVIAGVSQDSRPSQDSKRNGSAPTVSKREVLVKNKDGEFVKLNKKDLSAAELISHLTLSGDGYGSLPNRILEILYQADFDKAEHEIIQFIIRESIFWRQDWTDPMTGVEFERLSGISTSSLWTHLKRLTEKGWIERNLAKIPERNQSRNQYRLNPLVWGPLLPKKRKENPESEDGQDSRPGQETRRSQKTQVEEGQEFRPMTQSRNQTTSSLYEKNLSQTVLKTSLSQHEGFNERWKNLPKRTREREMEVIQFLTRKFPEDTQELFNELERLETDRVDHFGKPCGSPIGLIESSWSTIRVIRQEKLRLGEEEKNKERERQHQKSLEAKQEVTRCQEEQVRAEIDSILENHFERLSENEVDDYLKRVIEKQPNFHLKKGSPAAMALIRNLLREDLKLDELEIKKLVELSLKQPSERQAVAS